MTLFLNPKHVTRGQYPSMSLHKGFVTEFLESQGNCLGLTYLKVGSDVKGAFVLKFQKPPAPNDLQDSFCFSYRLIKIKNKPFFQVNIHVDPHLFQSFLLLEHPLIKSVLRTVVETQEILFLILHEGGTLSVHGLSLAKPERDQLEKRLSSIQQDLSWLITGDSMTKSLLKPYEKDIPDLMTLVCTKNLGHLNLSKSRIALEKLSEQKQKTG